MTLLIKLAPGRIGLTLRSRVKLSVVTTLLFLRALQDVYKDLTIERALVWKGSPELVDVDDEYVLHQVDDEVKRALSAMPIDEVASASKAIVEKLIKNYQKRVGLLIETYSASSTFTFTAVVYPTSTMASIVNKSLYREVELRPPEVGIDLHGYVEGEGGEVFKVESFYDLYVIGGRPYELAKIVILKFFEYLRTPIRVLTYAGIKTFPVIRLVDRVDVGKSYDAFGSLRYSIPVYRRRFLRDLYSDIFRELQGNGVEEVKKAVRVSDFVHAVVTSPELLRSVAKSLLENFEVYAVDAKGRYAPLHMRDAKRLVGPLLTIARPKAPPLQSHLQFIEKMQSVTLSSIQIIYERGFDLLKAVDKVGTRGFTWKILVEVVRRALTESLHSYHG